MNRGLIVIVGLLLASVVQAAGRDDAAPAAGSNIVQEAAPSSVFRGALYKAWRRLRAFSPAANEDAAAGRGSIVVTAGIRGAESTESALQPYWKDDRSDDKDFIEQLNAFNAAQALADAGNVAPAASALAEFTQRYPQSELLPNALFAQAVLQGAAGDNAAGIATLNQFLKNYPQHPLKTDAEAVLAELKKP